MVLVGINIFAITECIRNPLWHGRASRTQINRARLTLREYARLIDKDFLKEKKMFPGVPYWGPLTEKMIQDLGGDPRMTIDIFGDHESRTPYHYYSNGIDFSP